jgi:hypothetical protein
MKIRTLFLAAIPAFLALQLSGCGDSPQPVDAPPPAASKAEGVSGTIVLEGAQFDAPTGTLFVSVRPKGGRMPWLSRKYEIAGVELAKSAAGSKSLPFALSPNDGKSFNSSAGQTPSVECEVCASYKETGDALSKTLVDAVAAYQPGKTDYVLTLKLP